MFWRKATIPPLDVNRVRQGLREAAAWCALAVGDDPDAKLWTPGLLDVDIAADEDALWKTLAAAPDATVEALCVRRAERLASRPSAVPERLDGRILVCEYDCTLFEGATELESVGLVDVWDVPAWDLWIGLVPSNAFPLAGKDRTAPLLCWIPAVLVPRAESATQVSSTEVFTWLDRRIPRLARELLRD